MCLNKRFRSLWPSAGTKSRRSFRHASIRNSNPASYVSIRCRSSVSARPLRSRSRRRAATDGVSELPLPGRSAPLADCYDGTCAAVVEVAVAAFVEVVAVVVADVEVAVAAHPHCSRARRDPGSRSVVLERSCVCARGC